MASKDEYKVKSAKLIAAAEAAEREVARIKSSPEYLAEEKRFVEASAAWSRRLDERNARARDIGVRLGVWLPHHDGDAPPLTASFVEALERVSGVTQTEAQEVKWNGRTSRYAQHPFRMIAETLVRRACVADVQWCALDEESRRLHDAAAEPRPLYEDLQAAMSARAQARHALPATAVDAQRAAAAAKAQRAAAGECFKNLLSGEITLAIPAPSLTVDVPQVTIPESAWRREDDNDHALLAQLVIDGVSFHVTAIAVYRDEDGVQHASDPAEEWRLDAMADIGHAGGAWQTSTIRGREYVIFATPHCT